MAYAVDGLPLPRGGAQLADGPRRGSEVEELEGRCPRAVDDATEHLEERKKTAAAETTKE